MLDIKNIRSQFPSLSIKDKNNNQIIYLDGPGGTQVPISVIEGISHYYENNNANTHGEFKTSKKTDEIMDSLREKTAVLLGAENKNCISIGQNMTTINFQLARGLSKIFKKGDEVIITELDHEANRGPWKIFKEKGIKLVEINLLENGLLDYEDFKNKINDKTVMIAMGMSSNALGTINDFERIRETTSDKNILLLLDAVHYAPHFAINVENLKCDFLLCSAYKFYGPHIGLLYTKPHLLDKIDTDRLIVQDQNAPFKIETGTLNHAACNGVVKAIDFISSLGNGSSLRDKIESSYTYIGQHEKNLSSLLFSSLKKLDNIKVIGPDFSGRRAPTVSFIHNDISANKVCNILAEENICAWDGHFYALKAIQKLDLEKKGGVTRLGVSIYNTKEEIIKTVEVISRI